MKITKKNFVRACIKKCTKRGWNVNESSAAGGCWWQWLRPSMHENKGIPRDVPKGHMVVYAGNDNNLKRHVIDMALLDHPLFQALLDHARDVYDFSVSSKLCIPCDENIFLSVVQCATPPQTHRRLSICLG